MPTKNTRLYIWIGALMVVSWSSLAFVDPDPVGLFGIISIGYFLGTLFAHTTIAATWMALGPGKLLLRIPLSLIWTGSLVLAIHLSIGLHGGPERAFVIGIFGQWLLLQLPLWGLALGLRLHLRHHSETDSGDTRQLQFGIVHLLVITAIAGAGLGIGRIGISVVPIHGEEPIFIFLAVAAIVLTLPLMLATLMHKWALLAVPVALALIAVATAWELSLMKTLLPGRGPNMHHLIAINGFSAIVILVPAVVVRLNGFCLFIRAKSA